jgi:hypothetical protein
MERTRIEFVLLATKRRWTFCDLFKVLYRRHTMVSMMLTQLVYPIISCVSLYSVETQIVAVFGIQLVSNDRQ